MLEGFDPSQREELKEWLDSEQTQAFLNMCKTELLVNMKLGFQYPDRILEFKGRKEQMEWVIAEIEAAHKEE